MTANSPASQDLADSLFDGAPAQAASAGEEPQNRVIEALFEFKVDRVFRVEGGWAVVGWQRGGVIRPGCRAVSENGAEIVFGPLRICGKGSMGRETLEFALQGAPAKAHLIQSGTVLLGDYCVVLPPHKPVGDGHKPSLAERRAIATLRHRPQRSTRPSLSPPDSAMEAAGDGVAVWSFR